MRKSRFPIRKLIIFLAVVLAVTGIMSAVILYLNGPSTSKPVTFVPPDADEPGTEKERDLRSQHFVLHYSSSLDTVSDISGNDRNALEIYRLSSSGIDNRRRLVITIKPMPPEGYEGESSYLLRKKDAGKYTERSYNNGNQDFIVFEEINGNEQTAFTRKDGKLAMLAYTISVPDADPDGELEALLNGFSWLN